MCVLSAVANEDRYGLQIIETVKKESGIKLVLGSLYNILYKLEKEGLVTSYHGEATAERGGNRRKYYKITAKGETNLNEAQLGLVNLWGGVSFLKKLLPNLKLNFSRQWRFGAMMLFMLLISNMPIYAASLSETLNYLIFSPVFIFLCFLMIFFLASVKWKGFIDFVKFNNLKKFKIKKLLIVLLALLLLYCEPIETGIEGINPEIELDFEAVIGPLEAIVGYLARTLLGPIGVAIITMLVFFLGLIIAFLELKNNLSLRSILTTIFSKIPKPILFKRKTKKEQNQTTSKIIRYFSYTLPSARREEIVGDLNETVALMRKNKEKPFVICAVLSWQMTRILFAMIGVKLSDFVRVKEKEQSK